MTSHFVVSDVHGHAAVLERRLREVGLVDAAGDWCGQDELWVLGDYFDRGPDGVAVVDDLIRWQAQAADAGGRVEALLGNHEVLTLGMRWFGGAEVPSVHGTGRSFERSWTINGGRAGDQRRLRPHHEAWLLERPLVARIGAWLALHSDTEYYLDWGDSPEEVNQTVHGILAGRRIGDVWECWRRLTSRGAFHGPDGAAAADAVLDRFGGTRIVHGHSTLADMLAIRTSDLDGTPHPYADGRALAIDGGLYAGGPLIIARLEDHDPPV